MSNRLIDYLRRLNSPNFAHYFSAPSFVGDKTANTLIIFGGTFELFLKIFIICCNGSTESVQI